MYRKYNKMSIEPTATLDVSFFVPKQMIGTEGKGGIGGGIGIIEGIGRIGGREGRGGIDDESEYRYYEKNNETEEDTNNEENNSDVNKEEKKGCFLNKDGGCSSNKDLEPVLEPLFNLREVAKQMILLEDHLFQLRRRCMDCIKKHSLTIEGFLEEAITLDKEGKYLELITRIHPEFKKIMKELDTKINNKTVEDKDYIQSAQNIRILRKELCELSYSFC